MQIQSAFFVEFGYSLVTLLQLRVNRNAGIIAKDVGSYRTNYVGIGGAAIAVAGVFLGQFRQCVDFGRSKNNPQLSMLRVSQNGRRCEIIADGAGSIAEVPVSSTMLHVLGMLRAVDAAARRCRVAAIRLD